MLGIYIRISKKKKPGEDTSESTQEKQGIELANQLGLGYEIYFDKGISGAKDDVEFRPRFATMLRDIEKGKITAVFTLYQDRIERNQKVWQLFSSIIIKNKCHYYPQGNKTDLTDPMAKFAADVMSASNALYSSLTAARVRDSIHVRALEGKYRGITAYGYRHGEDGVLTIEPTEAESVKRMYTLSLEGNGVYHIANIFNKENIPTRFNQFKGDTVRKDPFTKTQTLHPKKDVRWRGNTIHDIIRNKVYKGEKWIKDIKYECPVIIPSDEWERVNDNLVQNKKKVGKKTYYKYLLNDLIVCGTCGRKLVGKKRVASRDNSYKCKGKIYPHPKCEDSRAININKLDSFLLKHLFQDKTLKEILLNQPIDNTELNSLEKKIKREKSILKKKEKERDLAYKRLLIPEFEDDEFIVQHLSQLKKTISKVALFIESLERTKESSQPVNRKNRTENLLSQYVEGMEFEAVKKIVHSLIDWIKINHQKEEKKIGSFIVEIKYKGYNEISTFVTNWTALEWKWVSLYRDRANTNEQKKEDLETLDGIYDFFGITDKSIVKLKEELLKDNIMEDSTKNDILKSMDEEFIGFEQVDLMNQNIVLVDSELIYFD
jgi:site-specific DNA recombinase